MTTYYLDYLNGSDSNSGSSWTYAWKTITNGVTASRVTQGDIVRIAKSGSPVSIGTATWTDLSSSVYCSSASSLVTSIDTCESSWTKATGGDLSTVGVDSAVPKQGNFCAKFITGSIVNINTLQAYHATGELNLSNYDAISFWVNTSASFSSGTWKISLCSDTSGSLPVDIFNIPEIPSTGISHPIVVLKSGGGFLGSSIKSISLSSSSIAPPTESYLFLDNIIACQGIGLNLQSLISKNNLEQGGDEGWFGIQSIAGSKIVLDNSSNCYSKVTKGFLGRGYSGTSGAFETYIRSTIKTPIASGSYSPVQSVNTSSLGGSTIYFKGGYNTSTGEQDGETFFDGLGEVGIGLYLSSKDNNSFDHLNFVRYHTGIYEYYSDYNIFNIQNISNCACGLYMGFSLYNQFTIKNINNNGDNDGTKPGIEMYGTSLNTFHEIKNCNTNMGDGIYINQDSLSYFNIISYLRNGASYGILLNDSFRTSFNKILDASRGRSIDIYLTGSYGKIKEAYASDGTISIYISRASIFYIDKSSPTSVSSDGIESLDKYFKLYINNVSGYSQVYLVGGNIKSQLATAGGSGKEWKMSVTSSLASVNYPIELSVAKIAVLANKLTTVSLYFKKSHATAIAGRLICSGSQIAGVEDDVISNCPDDTNRNQVSIQFTPTENGVVEIKAQAWYVSSTADYVIIDDINVTRAP